MKKELLFVYLLFYTGFLQIIAQTSTNTTITSGGIARTFRTYVPAVYTGQEARPLVFQFHGSGGTSSSFQNLTNFRKVADTANFILITPQGTLFPQWGFTDWNAYVEDSNGVDDVLFVQDMLDTLSKKYKIDTTRIYASGWSAGGYFSQYLGWKMGNRIAAVGSVSGGMTDSTLLASKPPRPISLMEIHGTADANVPYNGGTSFGQVLEPVDTVVQFWNNNAQINSLPTETDMPNTNTTDGCTPKRLVWSNGKCGTEVQLIKIIGGGHGWPGWTSLQTTCKDFTADTELWRFFLAHSLDCKTTSAPEPAAGTGITVWPNPATDLLQLDFSGITAETKFKTAYIFDIYGRNIAEHALNGNQMQTIQLKDLKSGTYFLHVTADNQLPLVHRFVVVR
jgi:polyhydroxybutyrate depolymerase